MSLTNATKARLVADARTLYERMAADLGRPVPATHACLYHAIALQMLLARRHGIETMLQAGTAQWPMCRPEEDDGIRNTHFAYQWDGIDDSKVMTCLINAQLPELHVWLAHRDPDTIIDPTTGTWPERAALDGQTWTGPVPPSFLWHTQEELAALVTDQYPLGITYQCDVTACQVADSFAQLELYPRIAALLGMGNEEK